MQTKPLLYGLIGFFIGGFVVSVAATTFEKDAPAANHSSSMTMSLEGKTGDAFDEAFLAEMIVHHEGALDMAELSAKNAKHPEIKQLSTEIIAAQKREITQMKQWQKDWGYKANASHGSMPH